jgi:hypothetical protein
MALLDLWKSSRSQLEDKHVHQIIAFAGSGKLQDGNDASADFREFLSHVPSAFLTRYADECLVEKFDGSGFALQDVVNQVGRRLGFHVEDGRYRGTSGQSGHDGLWHSANAVTLVVEVKTTDAYRIDLDTLAEYQRRLVQGGQVSEAKSSILIVVGRQDTGDLEAQIRGSRHAWDIRLISVDALLRLMRVKEQVEGPETLRKISGILIPQEFTRVDGIIDLVFSAAEEVRQEEEEDDSDTESSDDGEPKPRFIPVKFHDACAERIQTHLNRPLVKETRATYASPDGTLRVLCGVSKEHGKSGRRKYWFAFHPHQQESLSAAKEAYVAFGCGSQSTLLLIPFAQFRAWLEGMNTTQLEDRFYWHVSIFRDGDNLQLHRKRGVERIDLTPYLLNRG